MESEILSKNNQNSLSNINLAIIKSNHILSKIFNNIQKKKSLEIVKFNKKLKNRLNLSIIDYKEYSENYTPIEIEIIPAKNKYDKFINITEKEKLYFHIYFNDNKEEIKNRYIIKKEDKVKTIKIIINYQVKSFKYLFKFCECIESINFKKFYRNNIDNMSYIFYECSSLKELNLSNFNTSSVNNMNYMFYGCSSLKELNLSTFNTNNVTNMSYMFYECSSLIKLNLSNFNTNNVINMSHMFYGCSSLKDLNLFTFNTNKVINMSHMFSGCSSDLKKKIISQNKNIKDEEFK